MSLLGSSDPGPHLSLTGLALAHRSDFAKRILAGRVLTFGVNIEHGGRIYRFRRGTISIPEDVSRVKLNLAHDDSKPIGVAIDIREDFEGIHGTFRVARTTEGDQLLQLAKDGVMDGFSAEFTKMRTERDRDGVDHVVSAGLFAVASTHMPAVDDARIAAMREPALALSRPEVVMYENAHGGLSMGLKYPKPSWREPI